MKDVHIARRGRPLGSPFRVWLEFRLLPFIGAHLVKILQRTLRVRHEGLGPVEALEALDRRFILAFYHHRLVMMPLAYPFRRRDAKGEPRGVAILSSDSRDGERSAAAWRWFGIHAVRGSASHGGAQALVKMIQIVKQGWDLGITVDGPKGPSGQVKPGVLAVSRKTGAWVVPVCVGYAKAWRLGSWDRTMVPWPFSRVVVRYLAPFQVPPLEDEAIHVQRLARDLDSLEAWAQGLE
jgi:hypothetical protein